MNKNKFYSDVYDVQNKDKCLNKENPVYKSLLECRTMYYLDTNSNITRWGYELIYINYLNPIDKRVHKYIPDFYFEVIDNDENVKKYLAEVKPLKLTSLEQLKKPKRMTKKYAEEVRTVLVNKAKIESAKTFCNLNGLEFIIITEKMINPNR